MQLRRDKKRDAVGRPSWRSSFLRDPGAEFFGGKLNKQKNSLNFASTCLKVVDNCRATSGRRGRTLDCADRCGTRRQCRFCHTLHLSISCGSEIQTYFSIPSLRSERGDPKTGRD